MRVNTMSLSFSLLERKEEWKKQEEERLASVPDPTVPPGHIVMSTSDRLKTLDTLKQRKM